VPHQGPAQSEFAIRAAAMIRARSVPSGVTRQKAKLTDENKTSIVTELAPIVIKKGHLKG
jgi:hypothetical protein